MGLWLIQASVSWLTSIHFKVVPNPYLCYPHGYIHVSCLLLHGLHEELIPGWAWVFGITLPEIKEQPNVYGFRFFHCATLLHVVNKQGSTFRIGTQLSYFYLYTSALIMLLHNDCGVPALIIGGSHWYRSGPPVDGPKDPWPRVLSRASEAGSPTNRPGSDKTREKWGDNSKVKPKQGFLT